MQGGSVSKIQGQYDATLPIKNLAFEYTTGDGAVEFRGNFDTPTTASGAFKMRLGMGPSACTFGPLEWTATSQ